MWKELPPLVIAINHELFKVGRTLDKKTLTRTINKIVGPKKWLEKPRDTFNRYNISTSAYLSLFEACIINEIPLTTIRRALNHYIDEPRIYTIKENWHSEDRSNFFRSIAIRACIKNNFNLSATDIVPKSWEKESLSYQDNAELNEALRVIKTLLPWYMVRAQLLSGGNLSIIESHNNAQRISSEKIKGRYREYDPLPFEITSARFSNLLLANCNVETELNDMIEGIQDDSLNFGIQINCMHYGLLPEQSVTGYR